MSHIFHFEQMDQQSMEPRQELVHVSASTSNSYSPLPTTAQLTRIFAAAIGSLMMAFFFLFLSQNLVVDAVITAEPLLRLGGQVILAGVLLALGSILFAGVPLAVVVWRSTPSSRFLLAVPFLAVVLPLIALIFPFLRFSLFALLLAGIPLTILAWQSKPRSRLLFTIPFLSIVVPLVTLTLDERGFASIVVLFADLLLTIAVWRLTQPPRIRLRLLIPFLAIALLLVGLNLIEFLSMILGPSIFMNPIFDIINNVISYDLPIIGNLGNLLVFSFACSTSVIRNMAINSAMRQATIPNKWLRFAQLPSRLVVFALVLMFLGLLFWGVYMAMFAPTVFFMLLSFLNGPWNSWLFLIVGMFVSVIVAARALSSVDSTPL